MKNIAYSALTDVGRVRTNNEDNYLVRYLQGEKFLLSVVIDGVGGYEGGEVAASMAASTISALMEKATLAEPLEDLKNAVTKASNDIYEARLADARLSEMSCVLTAALVDLGGELLYLVHIGDTRLYEFAGGTLRKLSHDHSLVGYWEESGTITEAEAMVHPRRNVIDRSLGDVIHLSGDQDFLDAGIFPIEPGSFFLQCSDGLYDMLTSAEISSVLGSDATLDEMTRKLVAMANEKGGKDNVTVIILKTSAEPAPKPRVQHSAAPAAAPAPAPAPKKRSKGGRLVLVAVLFFALGYAAGFITPGFIKRIEARHAAPAAAVPDTSSMHKDTSDAKKDSLDRQTDSLKRLADSLKIQETIENTQGQQQ